MDDARIQTLRAQATGTVTASWRHMAGSVALCAAIFGWYSTRDTPAYGYAGVGAIGAFLVAYNLVRIHRARAALAEPSLLEVFWQGQRRSHRARGRSYLVLAPIVVAMTWAGMLRMPHEPMDAWIVLVGATLFLAFGWIFWFRAVRRSPHPRRPFPHDVV
jgi:hypothetical protein